MAYVRKRGKAWQAIVRIKGFAPVTATRPTKREAELWAQAEEAALRAGKRGQFPSKTLSQALDRYHLEVSPKKRIADFEGKRFEALKRDFPALCAKLLTDIDTPDLAKWRDARLKVVTAGTVQRDINLFRNVWTYAIKEWKWAGSNPWSSLKMPGNNPARHTTWRWQQIKAMLRRLGYITGQSPKTKTEEIAYLFLLGLHTGMRVGELVALTADRVDLERRVVTLNTHKTVKSIGIRHTPITRRSLKHFNELPKSGSLFTVSPKSVDALFRKCRAQVGITGLTFHDSRATFATLMSRRTDPLTLARLLGHKDLQQLTNTYYRERPEQIAARL